MFSSVIQILGLASISIGLTLWALPAGIIFAGVALVLIGLALEKGN